MWKLHWTYLTFLFYLMFQYYGCSEVDFSKDESAFPSCQGFVHSCVTDEENGLDHFDYSFRVGKGIVDVIFVVDNSASMSPEHNEMAAKFSSFLEKIEHLDYRLAVVTTDVSFSPNNGPRAVNLNGALQDGRLILFNGNPFLTPDTPNKEALFAEAIQRKETQDCEAWLKSDTYKAADYSSNCPSPDERGIYALNLLVSQNTEGLIRDNAHLAVIILSDEDNRSIGEDSFKLGKAYALKTLDQPESFLNLIEQDFDNSKTLKVHSIVVKPGDEACLDEQNDQGDDLRDIKGQYGSMYAALSEATGGVIGDVCADDYSDQLGAIGFQTAEGAYEDQIACADPVNFQVLPEDIPYELEGTTIRFKTSLPLKQRFNSNTLAKSKLSINKSL